MDESLIRGLVMGAVLGAAGLTATLVWKLLRSPSEAARRTRTVLLVLAGLGLTMAILTGPRGDRPFFIGLAFVLAAGAWIYKGTKK